MEGKTGWTRYVCQSALNSQLVHGGSESGGGFVNQEEAVKTYAAMFGGWKQP